MNPEGESNEKIADEDFESAVKGATDHLEEQVNVHVDLNNKHIENIDFVKTALEAITKRKDELVQENKDLTASKGELETAKTNLENAITKLQEDNAADKKAHGEELEKERQESVAKQQARDKQWVDRLKDSSEIHFKKLHEQHAAMTARYQSIRALIENPRDKRQTVSTRGEKLRRLVEKEREKLEGKFELHGLGHYATNGSPVVIGQDSLAGPFGGYLN